MSMTIEQIAALVGGISHGDARTKIFRVAALETAESGEVSFVEKAETGAARNSKASCLLVPENFDGEFLNQLIKVKNPKLAFARVAAELHAYKRQAAGAHQTAIIAESSNVSGAFVGAFVVVGENTFIGEGAQILDGAKIGDNVKIGKNSIVHRNCVIYDDVCIGDDCTIHSGAVIGADGFGFVRGEKGYVKFPQIGTVVIEDAVEIGANACIDRGALGETRIGCGTKIDNLVQIAHNVRIGERVVIAAQTGISGSTVVEDDCVIGGQVGMGDHARVLSGAIVGSQAGILPGKIVRAGVWWGTPVQPLDEYKRQNARVKGLARLKEELREIKKQISKLTGNG